MKRTFLYEVEADVFLCAHSDEPPTVEEWDEMVAFIAGLRRESLDVLVVTDTVGPNARQRSALTALPGARNLRQAVITPSVVVRGMATALAWMGLPVRPFAPDEIDAATAFLGITADSRPLVVRRLAGLRARIAGAPSLAGAGEVLGLDPAGATDYVLRTPLKELGRKLRRGGSPQVADG